MLATCLLTFLAGLTAAAPAAPAAPATPTPPNGIRQCARSECPVYTELEDLGPDMWKRRIEPGVWARKLAPTCNGSAATGLVYLDLHFYFTGNGINRTTPIMLEISDNKARPTFCPDQSDSFPCCNKLFGLLFYIPEASQATAPLPTPESGVELVYMEDPREFFGINFSGRPIAQNVTAKYNELTELLDDRDIPFDDDAFIVATYDAPWRPLPHRNEVLIPIKRRRRNVGNRNQDGSLNQDGNGNQDDNDNQDGNGQDRNGGRQRRSVEDLSRVDLIPFGI